ncbi:MAG TPA: hypothetical protein VF802_09215 [Candidatus Limnocylindrales bacterium]
MAGRRLIDAHIVLARAELAAIVGEIKIVAIGLSGALAMLLFVAMLVPIGLTLFLGEWLFGSMGWGILHGTELAFAIALVFVLVALRVRMSSIVGRLVVAVVVGVVVALVFALGLAHEGWTRLGDSAFVGVDAANRPLVAAFVGGAIVIGILAALAGLRGGVGGFIGGLVTGAVVGALVGAFTAISFTPEVAAAIGTAVALAIWPALCALLLRGYDWESLKDRFMPTTTIETGKETLEWLKSIRP